MVILAIFESILASAMYNLCLCYDWEF